MDRREVTVVPQGAAPTTFLPSEKTQVIFTRDNGEKFVVDFDGHSLDVRLLGGPESGTMHTITNSPTHQTLWVAQPGDEV